MKTAVVTGISTGIGHGTVSALLAKGWHVFGSVRKESDAVAAVGKFGDTRFTPLIFDVTDNDAVLAAVEQVRKHLNGRTLDGLVNNAGSSYTDPLMVQSIDDFRMQMEVNVVGMFAVTRSFFPLLGGDPSLTGPKGRIVNLGSVGGRIGFPLLGAYVTAKHAVEGLSAALRRELQLVGIDVIVVAPGPVQTSIWNKAEALPYTEVTGTIWDKPFRKYVSWMIDSGRRGLTTEHVGNLIAQALTTAHPKTRYAPVQGKFFNETVPSLLPDRVVDRILGRQFGLLP
ncbi:SDR family NAD(P)-dependent oxidoreductase [Glaciihabitans sp. UYNi722]|uniref:SDR family NAD(P)-dependent oxidoreductase n=1 Tax=Glaciihabitans sp. UYNi722 TaxID=3156344 RepID=UPI00339A9F78